jgi:hypothetical protein
MMSSQQIHDNSYRAATEAAKFNHVPFVIWPGDIDNWRAGKNLPVPFPMLGDYVPPGYETIGEPEMVDVSGFGTRGEPALTLDQMLDWLEANAAYAFVELGQFQGYIQKFRKIDRTKSLVTSDWPRTNTLARGK